MQPVSLSGIVTPYKGNGRRLGYPTANLSVKTNLQDGVYFGFADLAEFKDQPALIFVGVPTTIGDKDRRVEAYLLDIPDQDYYGKNLRLTIGHFHRPNQKFESIEKLIAVIQDDEATARQWFAKKI